ncbi:MAG: MOSC domain-containing protein [Gammaproteobacteria bacterium]|nr:MOSC domain-containing protein [Gammaproteobacteria bacterium]
MSQIVISELVIYPLKSAAGIPLETARIDTFGLENDRRWMLIDEQGKMLTQRQHAKLCLLNPQLLNNQLRLNTGGFSELIVPPADTTSYHTAIVWDDHCRAYDCGEMAAEWLSDFMGIRCRLVYFPADEKRQVDTAYAETGDRTAFSDGFPILLTSQSSLDDLNQRLAQPVAMRRFRPNIVIRGATAYAEDEWQKIRFGDIDCRIVKPCSRCIMPNIDPATARIDKEPSQTLAGYRKKNNKVFFGQNLIHDQQGTLSVGMPAQIIRCAT